MKPRGRGLYLKCLTLLSLNLLSKPHNILSSRKMISSQVQSERNFFGCSIQIKIFFVKRLRKRLRKIWKELKYKISKIS